MTPAELQQLSAETYVMLRPSSIDGVGVFALRDIPLGFCPFAPAREGRHVTHAQLAALPTEAFCLAVDFGVEDADGYCIPGDFRYMDMVYYLNHSATPNVRSGDQSFRTTRNIRAGEELFIDYLELEHRTDGPPFV